MNILVIPVQSVSDLITNSSSEVFILETGKKLRSGEIEDDWSYPGTIFSIANGWFKDALEDVAKEFLKNYNGPTVWNVSKGEDGKVLVVSNDDNSIPYDTWDKIRDLFNGWNVHLG